MCKHRLKDKKDTIKEEKREISPDSNLLIPSSILKDTTLSVLESIVEYLKEKEGLRFRQIGILLNRDERNIWTVYNRAKKKRAGEEDKTKNER